MFAGDFLDGLEIDRSPHFNSWLIAQRRRFTSWHAAILEHLVNKLPADADEMPSHLDKWLELAPFDGRAHVALLTRLAQRGQFGAGEEHLASAAQLFASEDLDFGPVREAWRTIRGERPAATLWARPPLVPAAPHASIMLPHSDAAAPRKASLAVMPFVEGADCPGGPRGGLADGLTHDIITRLAKL
ncbi:MAG: transcriptional regulator, partial [Mesorhizobium sp.]